MPVRLYDWSAISAFYEAGHSKAECKTRRGDLCTRPAAAPISTYLVKGRRVARGHLKGRLLAEGFKENRCEECGLDEWRGKSLPLALHHVNGDGDDNRLANLQLLCGNCHSQTPNFSAKNKGKQRRLPPGAVWLKNVPHRRLPVRGVAA